MAKTVARREKDEALRVALLLRVSDPRQAGADAFSLDAQRHAAKQLCERKGWVIVREYIGAGESDFTREINKRETVRSLLADATADVFDVLLVHDLTRYARDEELGHSVLNNLQILGVKLVNATNDVDYDTPEGRLMFSMELGFSAASSRKASFHIKKAKQQKFEMGLHVGDVPFGYAKGATNKDPLVPVPREAAAILEALRDYAAGAGYTEIARRWNEMGLKPHSKQKNCLFTASAVQSVTENEFYAGYIHHRGERRRGIHEPIVPEERWAAAQARVRRQPTKAREPWLLAGIAMCAVCGGPIWQCKSGINNDHHYYREPSGVRQRGCGIAGSLWSRDLADSEVDDVIAAMTLDPAWLAEVEREALRPPVGASTATRAGLEAKKKRFTNAYLAGMIPEVEWRAHLRTIDAELARTTKPNPGQIVLAGERLVSIGQVWKGMTTDERRDACRILFRSIHMNPREKRLWLDPWPEFAEVFEQRRRLCMHGTPGRTRTCAHGLGNHCSIL
jgi:DNA invertase Pin-like site-specific DNA recombinase